MSLLDGLGLEPDPEAAAAAAPEAPAAPTSVTGLPAQPAAAPEAPAATPEAPEAEEEIQIPEGAENPDAVKALISAERKAARDAYKRAREAEARLAEIAEANMPVEERLTAAQQRAQAAELRAKKLEVGLDLGLPKTFAEMLQGDDEATIKTNAQAVLAELQSRTAAPAPVPLPGGLRGGDTPAPPAPADPALAHNNFLLAAFGRRPGA